MEFEIEGGVLRRPYQQQKCQTQRRVGNHLLLGKRIKRSLPHLLCSGPHVKKLQNLLKSKKEKSFYKNWLFKEYFAESLKFNVHLKSQLLILNIFF
jgi:hypothetical protein